MKTVEKIVGSLTKVSAELGKCAEANEEEVKRQGQIIENAAARQATAEVEKTKAERIKGKIENLLS